MKKLISIVLSILFIICVLIMVNNSNKNAEDFTVEEHVQRVTERRQKEILESNNVDEYKSFVVYPLYDNNDELKYFLIEHENYGEFYFVFLQDEPLILMSWLYANKSMYVLSANAYSKTNPWTPYKRDKNTTNVLPALQEGSSNDSIKGDVILDENGDIIICDNSPYYVTNNIEEKKYLLVTDDSSQYICAIKKDNKYINLISGEEFVKADKYYCDGNATILIERIAHGMFDL